MNAALAAQAINWAFSIIAGIRRMGMATDEINARLDRVDRGEEAITADEIRSNQDAWQNALNEGREL